MNFIIIKYYCYQISFQFRVSLHDTLVILKQQEAFHCFVILSCVGMIVRGWRELLSLGILEWATLFSEKSTMSSHMHCVGTVQYWFFGVRACLCGEQRVGIKKQIIVWINWRKISLILVFLLLIDLQKHYLRLRSIVVMVLRLPLYHPISD